MVQTRSSSRQNARLSTDLFMLGVVFIWGINFSAVKTSLHDFAPLAFNALRFGFATLIILGVLRLRGESLALARRDLLPVFLLGLSGHTLYQVLFINGIARTTAANSSLLMATSPIFVAIYGSLLRIERANRLVWVGILLSFLGVGLLVLGGDKGLSAAVATIVGDLLVLGAAMMWGAYTTFSKPLLARYSPLKLTALTMVVGTSVLVLVSAPALVHQNWSAISATAWGGLFYSTSMAVAVAYVVWYTSVQRVGSARTAIYSSLTPVIAVLVAWIALGDRMTPLQILGAVVVLAGILLTRRGRG